jgi:hypothetical protein
MTTASSIITDAYRESNLIPMGNTPNTNQQTEALGRLNTILLSLIGYEVGEPVEDVNIGGTYDQSWDTSYYVPSNVRLILNLSSATTLKLHPQPFDGQRLVAVDAANNLGTHSLTLDGNGRQIEGAATLTLNTNGDTRQWIYHSESGNWVKVTTLLYTDTMPYPAEFDDFFITTLAMRLNPRYGQALQPETVEAMKRARGQLRARYHAWKQISPDYSGRGLMADTTYGVDTNLTDFNLGRPFPWR